MGYDLAIRGGTILDGTGAEGYRGDVGIRDGRVVALGTAEESANETIEADGRVVAPGFVEGGMTARHVRDAEGRIDVEAYEKILEQGRRRNPLGITGKPEDIAQAFLYLASDASRYMTGQVLHANGGAYMP